MVRALWNGEVVAESDDTVVIDHNHYFPADAVNRDYLVASDTSTVCGWKGRASYYSLSVGDESYRDAAWYYPSTSAAARSIEGRIAFARGVDIEDEGNARRRRSLFDRFRRDPPELSTAHESGRASAVAQPVRDLDDNSFFTALDGRVTIADFWAPWCGPCTTLHPLFDRAAGEHTTESMQFVRVNVDESPGISSAFQIMSIPTIIVLDAGGSEIDREIGVPSRRRLEQLVRHAGSLANHATKHGAA
jgi:thioredoxin